MMMTMMLNTKNMETFYTINRKCIKKNQIQTSQKMMIKAMMNIIHSNIHRFIINQKLQIN